MAKFERYAKLEILRGSQFSGFSPWKTFDFSSSYDCMNMKFNVEIPYAMKESNKANISVCGMTKDNIEELTMFLNLAKNLRKYVRVKLYVGYKDDNDLTLIFAGDVVNAKPTQPPDVWLEMECLSRFDMKHEIICKYDVEDDEKPLKDIYQSMAQWMALSLDWKVKGEGNSLKVPNFSYNGSAADVPRYMTKMYPCVESFVSVDNASLICVDRDSPDIGGDSPTVSQDTMMLGVPEPTVAGIKVNTFLWVGVRKCMKIVLVSDVYPAANGVYIVHGITHSGEIRGGEWKTNLDCKTVVRFAG